MLHYSMTMGEREQTTYPIYPDIPFKAFVGWVQVACRWTHRFAAMQDVREDPYSMLLAVGSRDHVTCPDCRAALESGTAHDMPDMYKPYYNAWRVS